MEHRPQLRPDVVEHQGLGLLARVNVVGLEQIDPVGEPFEQKRNALDPVVAGEHGVVLEEPFRIVASVVGWYPDSDQQNASSRRMTGIDHRLQVASHLVQIESSQAVVGTQLQHHDVRFEFLQQRRQPGASPARGVAADACVHDAILRLLPQEAFRQAADPAGVSWQPVFGREAVADHEDRAGRRLGPRGCRIHRYQRNQRQTQPQQAQVTSGSEGGKQAQFPSAFAVEASDLCKIVPDATGSLTILDHINLAVAVGQTLAIRGASGSGKSTLLGLLAGLDVPTSGTVRLFGQDLTSLDEDGRARLRAGQVGFVFQSFQLLDHLTALENVMLPLEIGPALMGRTARQHALKLLERVGLAERSSHETRTLSGGEQQRVALARAFVTRPTILFADEPTGSLDSATGAAVIDLMFELNREFGSTLVVVTHDPEVASRCARRVELRAGRIAGDASEAAHSSDSAHPL